MASSHDQPTRVQPSAPQPAAAPAAGGSLDIRTLIITAAASALAAFICSKVWAPGTLASAAFTPVAVALFREALNKPTAVVTQALPAALPIARRGTGADQAYGAYDPDPTQVHRTGPASGEDPTRVHRVVPAAGEQPTQVSPAIGAAGPAAVGAEPVAVHAVAARSRRRRWQIAIGTGLLGFVIAALLITVPEVIAGKNDTTIFNRGGNTPSKSAPAVTTTVVQQPTQTTVTQDAPETVTQEAPETVTQTVETTTVTEDAPATTTRTTPTTTTTTPGDPTGADGAVDGP